MKKILALVALGLLLVAGPAMAGSSTVNYSSSGSSPFRTTTDSSSNNIGQTTLWDYSAGGNGAGVNSNHGLEVTPQGSNGAELFTSGNAGYVQFPSTQSVNATLQASATTAIGKVDPNTAASWALGATGAAVPANGVYLGMNVGGNLTGLAGTANGLKVDGSAVTQPVSGASGSFVDGAIATIGTKADAAWTSGSGSQVSILKTIANNTGAAVPAGTNVIGFTSNDPCAQGTKLGAPINLTASGQIIAGTSAKKTYICSINLVSATAQNIALVEGTGTTCATNIHGLAGGTTAATGWNLAANGGLTEGSGSGTVISPSGDTNAAAANVCLLLSSTGQTSGQITYVQQ